MDIESDSQNREISPKDGKKKGRGRPTIPSNFLIGSRNAWICLLEEGWPEIGWSLICIRNRRTSGIVDIQRALVCLRDKPNGGLADRVCRDSREPAESSQIRRNWKTISGLDPRILEMQAKRNVQERACLEAESALKQAEEALKTEDPKVMERIQREITRRRESLDRTTENVAKLQNEREALYRKVIDQESYFCRSELLDFLHSGRYAVKPRPLANTLAGLPHMRWRQSHSRCSKMPYDSEPHLFYQMWDTIRKIWKRRRTNFDQAPTEFLKTSVINLPKKAYVRQLLCENWGDLRLAIEESWNSKHPPEYVPFVITTRFIKLLVRQKNAVERVLADQERLA